MSEISKLKRLITFHLKREAKIMDRIKALKETSEIQEVLVHIFETSRKIPTLTNWIAEQDPEQLARIFQGMKTYHQKVADNSK